MKKSDVMNFGPSFLYYIESNYNVKEIIPCVPFSGKLQAKGWHIHFDNGMVASIQFGTVNDCNNRYESERADPLYSCQDAELASWHDKSDPNENWESSIVPFQNIEETLEWIYRIANA